MKKINYTFELFRKELILGLSPYKLTGLIWIIFSVLYFNFNDSCLAGAWLTSAPIFLYPFYPVNEKNRFLYESYIPVTRRIIILAELIYIILTDIICILSFTLLVKIFSIIPQLNKKILYLTPSYIGFSIISFALSKIVLIPFYFSEKKSSSKEKASNFCIIIFTVFISSLVWFIVYFAYKYFSDVPFVKYLRLTSYNAKIAQLPFLFGCIIFYFICIFLTYKRCIKLFKKVDL